MGLALGLAEVEEDKQNNVSGGQHGHTSGRTFKSAHGTYKYAGVATDNEICSKIGK